LVDHAGYSGNPKHPRQPRLLNPWTYGTLIDDEYQEEEEHHTTATIEDPQRFVFEWHTEKVEKEGKVF